MKRLSFAVLSCLALTIFSFTASSQVVISEFMADNTRVLFDEDGDSEDWIEVRNVSAAPVNLQDWCLSDAAGNLTKWRFPATNLNVGAYLVVFASNKDRRTPGRPLHTNFRLDPDGEFLALVKPDGITIATQFAPSYSQQAPNVSFGSGLVTSNSTLVSTSAAVRVLVPAVANGGTVLGDIWKGGNEPFPDGGWIAGATGVGFSAPGGPSLVATSSLTLRFNFDAPPAGTVIADTKPIGVPLNGVNNGASWVASSSDNSPTALSRSGVMQFTAQENDQITLAANASLNSSRGAISFWMRSFGFFGPAQGPAVLLDRENISANLMSGGLIQQNDDGRLAVLGFTNGLAANATVSAASPSDDRWHHIVVVYDQTSTGSVALYIDGTLDSSKTNSRAWAWAGTQIELGRSHEAAFRKYHGLLDDFRIYNRQLAPSEVAEIYAGDGGVSASDLGTDLAADMLNVVSSAFIRIPFTVADSNAFSLLTLRVRHNDGFVAWINGQLVASVNAPEPLAWDSAAVATNNASSLADSVTIGSTPGLLKTGANILAIQGLNVAAGDPTFLVYPELVGASVPVDSTNGLYFTQPTPGAANTGGTTNVGPAVSEVTHSPNAPLDADDLLVTARVEPTFGAISNVTLRYRIMYANEVSVPMNDTGSNGDEAAGDGIFSAPIPASASTNGQMIRYYVSALSTQGASSKWPLFYNPTNSEQYLGTVINPGYVTSKLPIYHLFINPTDQGAADGENGTRCSVFYDGEFYDNVRIELRGNTSASFNKKAHRLEFNRDHRFRHSPDFPRVGDTSLLGESADPAYMRQMFSFWLTDAMGVPSPFNYPVRVQNNGVFYQLAFHSDVMGIEQLERFGFNPNGALYKAVGQARSTFESTGGFEKRTRLYEDRSDYLALANGIVETNPTRGTNIFDMLDLPNVINYLVCARWVTEADDVWANMTLYRDTEGDQLWRIIPFDMNVAWGQLYCSDSYPAFNAIIATNDNYKSHPLYGGSTVLPTAGGANWNRIYDVIVRTPATREMLLRRMRTLMDRFVQPPNTHPLALNMEKMFLSFSNSIYAESILDRQRWGFEAATGSSRGPYCYGNGPDAWMTNHITKIMKEYVGPRRFHWYVTHCITNTAKPIGINNTGNAGIPLSQPTNAVISVTTRVEYNPSGGNQAEEFICLTNGNPYAVDISGWKLDGGVEFTFAGGTVMPSNSVLYVSPNLLAFRNRAVAPRGGMGLFVVGPYQGQLSARGEPLTITDTTGRLVYTNVYAGNPSLAQQFLRVTEVMYNPSPLAGNTNDAQEFEYIELKNISTTDTIGLTGVRFINGILFDFTGSAVTSLAPGQRALVVKNQAAFTARYGAVAGIAGQYTGALDSSGERVQLVDAANEEILDFSFNNSWYPVTDGLGFSLVIINESGEPDLWDQKIGWRPSGTPTGAPGQNDPAPPDFAPIIVNEVLTHTDAPLVDAVELLNPTASPVNIGGWFLTDDFNTPRKYRIASNTTIAAGGYVVFDETQFNTPSNAPTSFSFSSKGDEVFLFSGDANTNLTGYFHGYEFGAAENGFSFGRYTNSQTNVHFVAQSARTLPGANASPRVGPVVISEIMYHPQDFTDGSDNSGDEYIELHNFTGSAVPLFLAAAPTNTWHLRGGVDFDFPTNLTLPANGYLLLVGFDPANAAVAADFRSRFGVPVNVPLYGPFSGKLDNSSDTVRLTKPDNLEGGEAPYVIVEEVEYQDEAPWPSAPDGTGAALQRRVLNAYSDDATNWIAVASSAGSAPPGGVAPVITTQPANLAAIATLDTMLSVTATGSGPLGYQWKFNGDNIPGATGSMLNLVNVQTENDGYYTVIVVNAAGVVESAPARVTVLLPAVVTQQPRDARIFVAPDPAAAAVPTTNFGVAAVSSSTIRYQWRFQAFDAASPVNIPGATSATLTIADVQVSNGGYYSVAITDDVGTIFSAPATLFPLVTPKIEEGHLVTHMVATNTVVTFGVAVSGSPLPMTYLWRRGSTPIATNTVNARMNFVTTVAPSTVVTQIYRVLITNMAFVGSSVVATNLVITAIDSDGDGIPDPYETAYGAGGQLDPMADDDGDGMKNFAEYTAGTDPTNALSYLKIDSIAAGGGATLQFNAESNRTYSVQYTDALGSGPWQRLTDVPGQASARLEIIADPNYTTNRFYRLAVPRQP